MAQHHRPVARVGNDSKHLRGGEPLRIRLLGGFQVSVGSRIVEEGEWRLRKANSLVKLLALAPNHRVHREQIMDALWPELDLEDQSNNLRQAQYYARRALEPAPATPSRYLCLKNEEITLYPDGALWVDVEAFEEAAATARGEREPAAYRTAIELYSGELLPEDRYEAWAEERREGLQETYLALLFELAGLYEERGEYGPGIEALRRVLSEEPDREEAHAGLLRLYALSGRRREALRQYERLEEILHRELGEEPGAESRRLRDEILSGRFPPARPTPEDRLPEGTGGARGLHNLPATRGSFVGRERAVVEVKRSLVMTGLLTLTGAGGSGKTRLALEVAKDLAGLYPDGVRLVELASLSEGALVPQAVAAALGEREQPGRPLTDTLADSLREKKTLLLLDNCEHLVDAAAQLADTLLSSCPRLQVLATSREPLGVASEAMWQVPPLSVPDADRLPAAEDLERYEAVRLFVARARLKLPGFEITPANAGAVAEVCRRLNGIPLAIELATARMTALAVEQIAERLKDSLKLLTGGARTADPRHRTMRATLEWSYKLLEEPEEKLFERLSVFAGGWTLEAAEAVGAGDGIEEDDVLDLLSRLVDKSLVVAEAGAEDALRYKMLEPVRQYAREKLEESGEAEAVCGKHAAFFLALAEEAEEATGGARHASWLERLEREHDNFRAALSWALDRGNAELGLRLSAALGGFWFIRGHVSEGYWWLTETLENPCTTAELARAKVLIYSAWMAWERGDYEESKKFGEECLTLSRELGDEANTAAALYSLGVAATLETEFERALALLEEARSLQRTLGDMVGLARTVTMLGLLAAVQGDHIRAQALHEEGLPLARQANDGLAIAYGLCLGAGAALVREDHWQVRALCEEGLKLSRQMGYKHALVLILQVPAAAAQVQGKPVRSARLWGATEALREDIGATFSPVEHYLYGPYIAAARDQLDEETWEAAWAEGQAMTPEQAIEYALLEEEPALSTTLVPEEPPVSRQLDVLTRREEEVAVLIARGFTNRQIAEELSISERTVETHVRNILKKLGLKSRAQLAARMAEGRLLDEDYRG